MWLSAKQAAKWFMKHKIEIHVSWTPYILFAFLFLFNPSSAQMTLSLSSAVTKSNERHKNDTVSKTCSMREPVSSQTKENAAFLFLNPALLNQLGNSLRAQRSRVLSSIIKGCSLLVWNETAGSSLFKPCLNTALLTAMFKYGYIYIHKKYQELIHTWSCNISYCMIRCVSMCVNCMIAWGLDCLGSVCYKHTLRFKWITKVYWNPATYIPALMSYWLWAWSVSVESVFTISLHSPTHSLSSSSLICSHTQTWRFPVPFAIFGVHPS